MPRLENENWEMFCHQYIATNFNKQKAYQLAYPDCNERTARNAGAKLYREKEAVRDRIQELLSDMYSNIDREAMRVVHELDAIAHAKITDFVQWDQGTIVVKSMGDIPEEIYGAIAELTEIPTENGPRIKVKMHDKMKALELKGRYAKMFTDKVEHEGSGLVFSDDFGTTNVNRDNAQPAPAETDDAYDTPEQPSQTH